MQLLLLRHAKSSWDNPNLTDRDRPLSSRGRGAASAMAAVLARDYPVLDAVFCSPSRRTMQTWERIKASRHDQPLFFSPEDLYHGDGDSLRAVLENDVDDLVPSPSRVLMVGHNPGLQTFAKWLAGEKETGLPAGFSRLAQKFPTGALAVYEISAGCWRDLGPATAWLETLIYPRDLD